MVLDPEHLDSSLDGYAESPVPQYAGLPRMVNRNDEAVNLVLIGGRRWSATASPPRCSESERTGSFLRAGQRTAAPQASIPQHRS